MTSALWVAVLAQMMMGAFDTLYHHEGTERLAWRPSQMVELRLHGVRNLAYAVMFLALGWATPHGLWAIALIALMAGELIITLWDFVEEDRTRHLPASERVTHTLLTLNYGVILAMLVPILLGWSHQATALPILYQGPVSWLCAIAAVGVVISGLRDLAAARRCPRIVPAPAAPLVGDLTGARTILVTGGTGFIGSRLIEALAEGGHDVILLARDRTKVKLPGRSGRVRIIETFDELPDAARIDAIVNLAGEPIANGPWTTAKRIRIVRSRLAVTYGLLRLIRRLDQKPAVLISGSAIGVYGLRGDEALSEGDAGTPCFSARLCIAWERAALRAEAMGVRTVVLRTGLVLDAAGGMLARMLTPFEFGLGGRFGNGRQWMSWIHRDDLVRLIAHCIVTPVIRGPVNGTAPTPVTNRTFTVALGRALRRPVLLPIPALPLRGVLGAFADELLLGGQRVLPGVALCTGFRFRYEDVDAALGAITGRQATTSAAASCSPLRVEPTALPN